MDKICKKGSESKSHYHSSQIHKADSSSKRGLDEDAEDKSKPK